MTLEDARIIVEDIGAHADSLEEFLEEDKHLDKSVGFHMKPESLTNALDGQVEPSFTCVPTEDLLAQSRHQAEGIWYKAHSKGFLVYSRTSMYRLTGHYMSRNPIDRQFNMWYHRHKSEGWVGCGGQCGGKYPPAWYNVTVEDAPFKSKQLSRCIGCIGYCRTARKHQVSG